MDCYSLVKQDNFWKLDKYDKIVISLIFIIVTMNCILNTFCYASENIDFDYYYNIIADETTNKFILSSNGSCIGFLAEKGYKYTIKVVEDFTTDRIIVSSSSKPEAGIAFDVLYSTLLNKGDYFTYSANEDIYITVSKNVISSKLLIEREPIIGLDKAIDNLVSNVGMNSFWLVFQNLIPYISVVVIFSLGVWFIIHNIIEHSKGRDF